MRSVPVQSDTVAAAAVGSTGLPPLPPPHPTSRAEPFFAPGPLVILFPRRFSEFPRPAPSSGIVGFLSEICTVRPAFPGHLPPPLPLPGPPSRSGQQALPRKRIWKWVQATVLTSFGLVLLLFRLPPAGQNRQCIFYNGAPSHRKPGPALTDDPSSFPSRVIWDPVNLPRSTSDRCDRARIARDFGCLAG